MANNQSAASAELEGLISEGVSNALLASAHATVKDARRFIEWYHANEHHSDWDRTRYLQAKSIVGMDVAIAELTRLRALADEWEREAESLEADSKFCELAVQTRRYDRARELKRCSAAIRERGAT